MNQIERQVSSYLDHLIVERGLAKNSLAAYRRDLSRYVAYCGSVTISDAKTVTASNVSDFLVAIRLGSDGSAILAPSSAARTVIAVRGFHAFLAREGVTVSDPSRTVKPPTAAKRLPKAITLSDVEKLLAAVGADASTDIGVLMIRDRALLELLYGTGARISELMDLHLDDVAQLSVHTPILRL